MTERRSTTDRFPQSAADLGHGWRAIRLDRKSYPL
jgi:hypothetical protein